MGEEADRVAASPTLRERRRWHLLVPAVALGAGLLFATSAATAQGTDLRSGRFSQLTDLVEQRGQQVAAQEQAASALRAQVGRAQTTAAASSSRVAAEQSTSAPLAAAAGLSAVRGPGVTVVLDDAPRTKADGTPASANPDDLVVHQQDVQSVVNALWAGGAEAMTLMGERVISTTAVRCVGNTLLVQGRLVGPPFRVSAIGNPAALRSALAAEPGVALFQRYVDRFGLHYEVQGGSDLRLPAYDGPLVLPHLAAP